MEGVERMKAFYQGKRVLITGHTGFKGSWLSRILIMMGAKVYGYSLSAPTEPSLYDIIGLENDMNSNIADIRDIKQLSKVFQEVQPEIVFHLAAQPIVLTSYEEPLYTYETNVMGTVHLLECVRKNGCVRSVVNVTTDKVYENNEWEWGYREQDRLNGYDPYSNSKSCSELVTHSYKVSFFKDGKTKISTARAGNVIGGGDFAANRIIPDCIRASFRQEKIIVRNPNSIRPYQHVLEPLFSYLEIAQKQYEESRYEGNYNIGPDDRDCIRTGKLAELFCAIWGEDQTWEATQKNGPHEANYLKLDCARMKKVFGWEPTWHVEEAVKKTIEWSKAYQRGRDMKKTTDEQIKAFIKDREEKRKGAKE